MSATRGGRLRLQALMAGALTCALLSACTGQMRQQSPISAQQRQELDKLAASKDSPEGLKEALAGIDADEKRRGCQDRAAAIAQQMQMLGMANPATMVAGRLGGRATTSAARMMAVAQAKSIQAQLSQMPDCTDTKS